MSLVAYASSGDDDSDSDSVEDTTETNPTLITETSTREEVEESNLFNLLPPPKKPEIPLTVEDDVDIPSLTNPASKKRPTVKITIPSLNEFQDDEDMIKNKKIKLAPKGSGLLGILPKPQNFNLKEAQRKLTPHILSKQKPTENKMTPNIKPPVTSIRPAITPFKTTSIIPRSLATKKTTELKKTEHKNDSDDDNEEEVTDFFSLDQKDELPSSYPSLPTEIIPTVRLELPKSFESVPSREPINPEPVSNYVHQQPIDVSDDWLEQYEESGGSSAVTIPEGPELFADEGFKRLTGKKKKASEDINFIEINAADQLPNKDEWLKSISVEQAQTSHKKTGMPSAQSRRKHQITYLAYQAKERELELKNQWAMNRMTRQQTQAKYGF